MKIRTQFVSNSSSSSFYMIAPKDILKDDDRLKSFIKKYALSDDIMNGMDDIILHIKNDSHEINIDFLQSVKMSLEAEATKQASGDDFYAITTLTTLNAILQCANQQDITAIMWEWKDDEGDYSYYLETAHLVFDQSKKEGIIRKSNH